MDISFFTNSFYGSYNDLYGGNFLSGKLPGITSFIPESGDILDHMPIMSFDIVDSLPKLKDFSGPSQFDMFDDLDWSDLLKKLFASLWRMAGFTQMFFNNAGFSDEFDIGGNALFSGNNAPPEKFTPPITHETTYTAGSGDKLPPPGSAFTGPANGKYDKVIEKYAAQYGVDPSVIKSIMAKESQGNPTLISPAGAVGLMQVKPETASGLLGRRVTAEELINNPELNIQVGTMYFAQLLRDKGNLDDALGAYNQGPNANWRAIPESIDYVGSITTSLKEKKLPTWG